MSAQNKAKITLRGYLGEKLGKREWNLAVKSVGEAIRAIDCLTKNKLSSLLYKYDKLGVRYKVLINGKKYKAEYGDDVEKYRNSGLTIKRTLKTLEIIPILQGSGKALDIFFIVLGVILVIVGAIYYQGLIGVGLALIGAGIAGLLSKPPKATPVAPRSESYTFNGPANVVGEGRPVPVGYGTLLLGSQRVAATFDIGFEQADNRVTVS